MFEFWRKFNPCQCFRISGFADFDENWASEQFATLEQDEKRIAIIKNGNGNCSSTSTIVFASSSCCSCCIGPGLSLRACRGLKPVFRRFYAKAFVPRCLPARDKAAPAAFAWTVALFDFCVSTEGALLFLLWLKKLSSAVFWILRDRQASFCHRKMGRLPY